MTHVTQSLKIGLFLVCKADILPPATSANSSVKKTVSQHRRRHHLIGAGLSRLLRKLVYFIGYPTSSHSSLLITRLLRRLKKPKQVGLKNKLLLSKA